MTIAIQIIAIAWLIEAFTSRLPVPALVPVKS